MASQVTSKSKKKMSTPGKRRLSTHANPQPATTFTANSSRRKGKRKTPSKTPANTTPTPKRCHRTDLLLRDDLSDIIAVVLTVLPNTTITTTSLRSNHLATQPANPLCQSIIPEEEWRHQEIGEWCF